MESEAESEDQDTCSRKKLLKERAFKTSYKGEVPKIAAINSFRRLKLSLICNSTILFYYIFFKAGHIVNLCYFYYHDPPEGQIPPYRYLMKFVSAFKIFCA